MIHSLQDQRKWPPTIGDPLVLPPLRRLPGRPKINRRREANEPIGGPSAARRCLSMKCSICKEFEHNRRSCQRAPVKGSKVKGQVDGEVAQQSTSQGTTITQNCEPATTEREQTGLVQGCGEA
ncbi:unnamed protein product [Ilex paraguariensis]|uniref:Uncharacterized protein n=1 Tax=Ilex paraguariensis TaxID=185542 RepID=A0ABC8SE23_9AQUA